MEPEIIFDHQSDEPEIVFVNGEPAEMSGRVIIFRSDDFQLPVEE